MISRVRLRWRFFWSRRPLARTVQGVLFAVASLFAVAYLAVPVDVQRQIGDVLSTLARIVDSLDPHVALALGAAFCLAVSLILIFVPSYRRPAYLAAHPSLIPPVSVYLDAENQIPERAIRPFIEFLMKHLDGRRADLLYFLDASQSATSRRYKTLYRFGFRPIDVPHDPMGHGHVKEAVDKELAMHAYERALLGPPAQEFVIVTGDRDFVPLIYRLAALGHRIQIWAAPVRPAYRTLATYLDVSVIDLTQVISELQMTPMPVNNAPLSSPQSETKRRRASQRTRRYERLDNPSFPRVPPPTTALRPGEEQLYYAIAETLSVRSESMTRFLDNQSRNSYFHSLMHGKYSARVAGVGYSGGMWLTYWLEHLIALGILERIDGLIVPPREPSATMQSLEESAAQNLFVMVEAAAKAAAQPGVVREDGNVHMVDVAAAVAANSATIGELAAPLSALVAPDNPRRVTHVRYFVRSARALGLLEFADVADSLDLIARPRLVDATPTPHEPDHPLPN